MIAVALLLFLSTANALPQGAPTKACQTMLPFHGGGIPGQQGSSPFGVTAIRSGGDVLVSVKSPIEVPLQGLMLQARIRDGELGGVFETANADVHTIACEQPGDTVTHSNPQGKSAVEVRWKPPAGYVGPVVFNATIAQDYSRFWVGVQSESLRISKRFQDDEEEIPHHHPKVFTSTPPHFVPEESTASKAAADPIYQGCELGKLCFGTPDGCVDQQNCKAVVAVTVSGDSYQFELQATDSAKWVGVGLSDDAQMGDDSILECAVEGTSIKPYLSWTSPRPNLNAVRITNPQHGIQLVEGKNNDGTLYCKVLRNAKTDINGKEFDLVNTKYYILVAGGTSVRENGVGFHDLGYRASSSERYLSDVTAVAAASKLLLRLHGAFMLAAWIGTASLGTFIARYYRKTWVGRTICGKDLWFAWHRFFMVLTWALTTVAFIIIFVELKAWSTESNPHAILGCIVTAFCFLQPIGAFFRPHPGTPKRPIFNWVHWFGGNAAHIIAIVTIFFAVKLNKAELPEWFDWILVAYVAFHVLMHLLLSILGCVSDNSSNQRVTAFPMKDLSNSGKMSAQMVNVDAPLSGARKMLLGLYILIVAGLTAALIVVAVLAPIET